jgi:glyoxylase-like metal-dependent hydrolase (beta-lactamase superfamily II)
LDATVYLRLHDSMVVASNHKRALSRANASDGFAETRSNSAEARPDCAPIPRQALGPAVNERGYYVGRVEGNLYWITDGAYQSAFLTTCEGVVLFDAPPSIGHNIQRAVNEIAAAHGVSNEVTHLIYSHHHADHAGASSLFGRSITRIGHEETRRLLLRDDDPARPAPEETFQDRCTVEIGGERIELAWHGSNHSPDNIFIHLPDHDALMLVDVVSPGWATFCQGGLAEDVPGYIEAADTALTYRWKRFMGGHMGRLGTRDDIATHREYVADIVGTSRTVLDTVDPAPYFDKYGWNTPAAARAYLDAITTAAAAPVIERYTGVLAAVDVVTPSTTFHVTQSMRLDLGYGCHVHP